MSDLDRLMLSSVFREQSRISIRLLYSKVDRVYSTDGLFASGFLIGGSIPAEVGGFLLTRGESFKCSFCGMVSHDVVFVRCMT